jgi:hypothetical protein
VGVLRSLQCHLRAGFQQCKSFVEMCTVRCHNGSFRGWLQTSETAVMARRRRQQRPGGHTTAICSGGRRAPISTDTASHTHTARSLACPLLTLSSACPFSNCIFRSNGAPASLPPSSSSLTHARRMDGFCNQNADQLGYLAGPFLLTVYVGVVECAPASPYTYSSSTHRFPDERTPIEATPLSATSGELGLGLGLGLGSQSELDSLSHSSSHALPFFSPPSFHTLSLSPVFTSVWWSA